MTTTNALRRTRVLATALLALTLIMLSGPAQAAAIDPWPSYQPQTTCSPAAKKGTLALAAYLQKHYAGSGSYGISRACGSGGRSEHKEGRAFDWRVNVNRTKERGYAYNFLARVRAKDSAGHVAALARRMGIMYLIFNDKIYSSSHNFAARAYLNAGCSSRASCSATLRHRDHMHISLTRAGGAGRTSWYADHSAGGGTTTPTPTPTPPDSEHEDSNIPTTSLTRPEVLTPAPGGSDRTRLAVRTGQRVKVTAFGVTRFGPGHQLVADAACVWNDQIGAWRQAPRAEVRARFGDPQLKVNGVAVFATATCRGGQHAYTTTIVQKGTVPIRVSLGGQDQHAGAVRVVLSKPSAAIGPTLPKVAVPARPPALRSPLGGGFLAVRDDVTVGRSEPVWSDEVLEAGVEYRVTVTGTRRIARGVSTDGQCLSIDGRWEQQGSTDLYRPGATHGALYLDGVRFEGAPAAEDPTGCTVHSHTMSYRPTETGRVALQLWDPTGAGDNDGALQVRFDRVTPVPVPSAAPAETVGTSKDWTRSSETFSVSAADADGRISSLRLRAGRSATIYVEGRTKVAGNLYADASCVSQSRNWTSLLGLASGQDLFEMSVDGQDVDWKGAGTGRDGCDSRHQYSARITASKNGPLRLALVDLDYGDNYGSYTVTIVRS